MLLPNLIAWLAVATAVVPADAGTTGSVPSPGLRLTEAVERYDVDAVNLGDFVAQMQARKAEGEGDWPGRTRATLQVAYRLVPTEPGCRIEDLDVWLDVVIRLPRWEPGGAVRPGIRDQWARMKIGIETHERGHRDIAVEAASRLATTLQAYAPFADADCAAVDRRILRERIKAQMRHQDRDFSYDRRTRHGLNQVPKPPPERKRISAPTPPASAKTSLRGGSAEPR